MEFLGYVIFGYDIHMDPYKVQTIVDCATLDYVQDVQCFLEVVNFYQRFITHYFSIVAPLIWLIINLFLGELKLKMPFNL
jgi:hypothetical protein